jgi:hypothetical protein
VPAEAQDRRRVPLEGDLEGGLAAALDLLDQPLVARKPQQASRRAEAKARVYVGTGRTTHENAVGFRRFAHNSRTSIVVRR